MPGAPSGVSKAWVRLVLHGVCGLPLLWLVWAAYQNALGPNPAEALIRSTGDWTLRMLCAVLAVTPLRQWAGWVSLARFRRMLGLWVATYATVHLLSYVWLDMGWDVVAVWNDALKRRFIWVGLVAVLCLWLLAGTSFNAAIRWLGGARWQRLHRLVYAVAALAVAHFWWMRTGKHNFAEVWMYGLVLSALLVARVAWRLRKNGK